MSRTTYVSTASYPMAVGWKCTNCGRINAQTCNISRRATASKQGLRYSKETHARASAQAQGDLMMYVANIAADAKRGKYSPVLNCCACKDCSHREPWATTKANGCFVSSCFVVSFWLGLAALICLYIQDWTALCLLLGMIAVLIASAFISIKLSAKNAKKMEPIFAALTEIERPVLAVNAAELRERMCSVIAQSPEDIDTIKKVVSREL